jgi:DNA-binding transcriptional MerR regulator
MSQGHAPKKGEEPALLSIGEVLTQLRAEFPDTSISKLRFLETEGLVQPQRTPSGYRKYSREDVARLRYVLAAQRDRYLPLRVIRQQLDSGAFDSPPPAPPPPPTPRPMLVAVKDDFGDDFGDDDFVGEKTGAAPATKVHREELCAQPGVSAELVADLERHGLIHPSGGDWFDADAVSVAEVAGRLAEYGIQARHLRGARVAADREAGLLAQVVAPLLRHQASGCRPLDPRAHPDGQREPASRARADEAVRELIALSQRLHLALLRRGLNETLGH